LLFTPGNDLAWQIVLILILLALAGWLFASRLAGSFQINIICRAFPIAGQHRVVLMPPHDPTAAMPAFGFEVYSMRRIRWRRFKTTGRFAILALALSALLLVRTIYNLYDLTLWDNTYDPLEYIWLIAPILAAILSGVMLYAILPDGVKATGILYPVLIPLLMIVASTRAQNVDFRINRKTGGTIVQAISSHHEREGGTQKRFQS
jgi:hypothetical protein